MRRTLACTLGLLLSLPATAQVPARSDISLTLYQQGLGLVREQRGLQLAAGAQSVALADISRHLIPESVLASGKGLDVTASSFLAANLSLQSLLERRIGQPVTLVRDNPAGGESLREQGVLLSAGDRPLVQVGERVEVLGEHGPWRLQLDKVPAGLRGRDALVLDLRKSGGAGSAVLDLSYLSQGLSWRADYVLVLAESGGKGELASWATLENRTGTAYPAARVDLVAGELNLGRARAPQFAMRSEATLAGAADMSGEASFDYYRFRLPEPVTLLPEERRQVRLLSPRQLPVEQLYRTEGYAGNAGSEELPQPVSRWLRFRNEAPALGRPLPAGLVRIYGQDASGLSFLGQDGLPHTPQGQEALLRLGNAFDLSSQRRALSSRRLANNLVETAWSITLRNEKKTPVTVEVIENLYQDWRILEENLPHRKQSAQQAVWEVKVPAGGQYELKYKVQMRM